jgi:DNA-nicking Smr family endonuclease
MNKDPSSDVNSWSEPEAVEVPINGQLDLHNFHPRDCKDLIHHYLDECAARGIASVRVIHGKGTGQLKAKAISAIEKHPLVLGHQPAGHGGGNWGATLVTLRLSSDRE